MPLTLKRLPWFQHALEIAAVFLGLVTYLLIAIHFVHYQEVVMDEGAYLYKGWLFIKGIYRPFQPYGPWTNKMPLSFLIYGVAQEFLGPGLATGRYFSVAASAIAIGGTALLLFRLASPMWAAIGTWSLVAMVALGRVYALAVSESIGAALLIWSLIALLREAPSPLMLFLGGLLAGSALVFRLNLLPLSLFALVFPLWAYGWRRAKYAWLGTILIPMLIHLIYWPDILRLWAPWFPEPFRSLLLPWQKAWMGMSIYATNAASLSQRVSALAEVLRVYPVLWFNLALASASGFVGFMLTQRQKLGAQSALRFKYSMGLLALTWTLTLAHAYVTIGQGRSLLFNMPVYVGFFAPLILVTSGLIFQEISRLPKLPKVIERRLSSLAYLLAGGLVGVGFWTRWKVLVRGVVGFAYWLKAKLPLSTLLSSKIPLLEYPETWIGIAFAIFAFFIGVTGFLVFYTFPRWKHLLVKAWCSIPVALIRPWIAITVLLAVLSPTPLFSESFRPYDCSQDALETQAKIAAKLSQYLFPGATIYWKGPGAVTPLLEIPFPVSTFPPQYNASFNYRIGGDPDMLYRYGYWNDVLEHQWREEADVFLLSKDVLLRDKELRLYLKEHGFAEFAVTEPQTCRPLSAIAIYRKVQVP